MLHKTIALLVFVEFSGFLGFILFAQHQVLEPFRYYPLYCSVAVAFTTSLSFAAKFSYQQLLAIAFATTASLLILYLTFGFIFFSGLVKDEELFSFRVINYSLSMVSLGTIYQFLPLSLIRLAIRLATQIKRSRHARRNEKPVIDTHNEPPNIVESVPMESIRLSNKNSSVSEKKAHDTTFFRVCIAVLYLHFIESSALVAYSLTLNTPMASTMAAFIGLATSLAICCAAAIYSSWYPYKSLLLISFAASWLTVSIYYQMRFDHCQPGDFGYYLIANTGVNCTVIVYAYVFVAHIAIASFFKYVNRCITRKPKPTLVT